MDLRLTLPCFATLCAFCSLGAPGLAVTCGWAAQPGAVVTLRGVTQLEKPIVLTPADSGKTFVGEPGAVLSGGIRLGPWTDAGGGVWKAPAPREADGRALFFDQLWVGGRRAPNARLPNEGYFEITNAVQVKSVDGKWLDRASFADPATDALGTVPAAERALVQATVIHKWSFARRTLADYEPATRTVTLRGGTEQTRWKKWKKGSTLVAFQNVRSAFDAPGEWFLDRAAGEVLYRPLPGERPETLEAVAPRYGLSQLVTFAGDPEKGAFVTNVTFRNITFAHTAFIGTMADGGPRPTQQYQAAIGSDGVIGLRGAVGCRFENCRIAHTSNYGMKFGSGCVSNAVVDCTLEDLGAGGIWMGEEFGNHEIGKPRKGKPVTRRVIRPDMPTATAFNLISNCTIRAAGRYNPEGTGVALAHCSDTKVVHCDIYDIMYTGVSVGWTWGFKGSVAQRNEIAFNRIYDLGKGILSDMGGIYTLGTSFGTRIHDNVIHDVKSYSYGGWGLYCDEGSEGIIEERNLCWNTTDGGFHQHYGTGCIIRNNIFAWNRTLGAVRMRRSEVDGIPCTLHFVNNIVLVREGPLCGKGVRRVGGVWANNLWYDTRGVAVAEFDGLKWKAWEASGKETNGRFADPRFVDAANFDFTLRPDSPARALGFKPWDPSRAGRKRGISHKTEKLR